VLLGQRTGWLWEQPEEEQVALLALDESLDQQGGLVAVLTGVRTA
jgi:hypothetical protein